MRKLEDEMRCASQTDASVMLTGESGVGKRYAASMIHQLSHRRRAPFVAHQRRGRAEDGPIPLDSAWPVTEGGFLQAAEDGTLLHPGHREHPGVGANAALAIHGSHRDGEETRAAHDGDHDVAPVQARAGR